jgi:hypothetical protein
MSNIVIWVSTSSVEAVKNLTGREPVRGLVMRHPMTEKSLRGFSVDEVDLPAFIDSIAVDEGGVDAYYFVVMLRFSQSNSTL